MDIAHRYNLKVIEDAAQANGGTYKGKALGSIGDAGCFSFQFHKIITAGEGGAITTDDKLLLNRAKAIHDTGANWRKDDTIEDMSQCPSFPGYNFRMNEITASILLVQLEKREEMLKKMKTYSKNIQNAIKDIPGVALRRMNDPEGEVGICVMFNVETRQKALDVVAALRAEGAEAGTMGDKNVPDWHIYSHWDHILNRRGNNDSGFPFTLSSRTYSRDMCPRTLDLLQTVIHMNVSPKDTPADNEATITGLRKVLTQLL
jgi:dTDP-4-amino-4,6-dideoxygalactose transaminase